MQLGRSIAVFVLGTSSLLLSPVVASATAIAPVITHGVMAPAARGASDAGGVNTTWSSSNWSGYAETGTFTGVSSTWTVPAVAASSSATYSSAWIGVDGFNDSNLIQTGTEEDYYSGSAHYDAWWEILPAAETEISTSTYPVAPGNQMSASIYETTTTVSQGRRGSSEHDWVIKLSNVTKGWNFSITEAYSGAGTSAEWIMEAPEVGGKIATLAHYTTTPAAGAGDFDNAGILTTEVSSGTPTYTPASLVYANDSGTMVQNKVTVSTPGDQDSAGTAFNVAYGSAVPATPTN
jgi:hypothetical protein